MIHNDICITNNYILKHRENDSDKNNNNIESKTIKNISSRNSFIFS